MSAVLLQRHRGSGDDTTSTDGEGGNGGGGGTDDSDQRGGRRRTADHWAPDLGCDRSSAGAVFSQTQSLCRANQFSDAHFTPAQSRSAAAARAQAQICAARRVWTEACFDTRFHASWMKRHYEWHPETSMYVVDEVRSHQACEMLSDRSVWYFAGTTPTQAAQTAAATRVGWQGTRPCSARPPRDPQATGTGWTQPPMRRQTLRLARQHRPAVPWRSVSSPLLLRGLPDSNPENPTTGSRGQERILFCPQRLFA